MELRVLTIGETLKNKELYLRMGLLLVYFIVCLNQFPHWHFTQDDLNTLQAALRAKQEWFGFAVPSSVKVLHNSFIYYLFSLPLHFSESFWALQVWIQFLLLVGHFFLIKTGKLLGSYLYGYCASILFFLSPAFLVFYSHRFWEPVLWPLASILCFWSLLGFLTSSKLKYLYLAFLFLIFAMSCHLASLFLVPVYFLALWAAKVKITHPRDQIGLGILLLLVGSSFVELCLREQREFLILCLLTPFLFLFALKLPGGKKIVDGLVIVLLLAVFYSLFLPNSPWLGIWKMFTNLSSGVFNSMTMLRMGMAFEEFPLRKRAIPEFALLIVLAAATLISHSRFSVGERLMVLWILIPLSFLLLFFRLMPFFSHVWFLVFYPVVLLALIRGLFSFFERRVGIYGRNLGLFLCLSYAALLAKESWSMHAYQRDTGLTDQMSPSLGVKQEVARWISENSENSKIIMITHPLYFHRQQEAASWTFIFQKIIRNDSRQSQKFFYLVSDRKKQEYQKAKDILSKEKALLVFQRGPVAVWQANSFIEGIGVELL